MYKIHNITIQVPNDHSITSRKDLKIRKCKDVTQVFNLKDTRDIPIGTFVYVSVMSSSHITHLLPIIKLPLDLNTFPIRVGGSISDVYYRPYTKVYAMNIKTCFGSLLLYKSGAIVMYTKSTEDILYLLCVLTESL